MPQEALRLRPVFQLHVRAPNFQNLAAFCMKREINKGARSQYGINIVCILILHVQNMQNMLRLHNLHKIRCKIYTIICIMLCWYAKNLHTMSNNMHNIKHNAGPEH